MEIILLDRIQNLGELGDTVNVKAGYARNYLIPKKKAVPASGEAKAIVEERRRELAKAASERLDVAKARAELAAKTLSIARKVSEEGKLFGSVSPGDIADSMTEVGTELAKAEVHMPEGPIKQIGAYDIQIVLHPEVSFTLALTVVSEE